MYAPLLTSLQALQKQQDEDDRKRRIEEKKKRDEEAEHQRLKVPTAPTYHMDSV